MVAAAKRAREPAVKGSAARVPVLVILDMNGVLLARPKGGREAQLRPHLDTLLATLEELVLQRVLKIAVWSSMMAHNLHPLVDAAFGDSAEDLEFVWDQQWCTQSWVPGMHKPLMRKDLCWLRQSWWRAHMPDRVLLIDDDPIKCTENPQGTAVHPSSFSGIASCGGDTELLRLSAYLRALALSGCQSVRDYVLENPYEAFDEPRSSPSKRRRTVEASTDALHVGTVVEAFWPDEALPDGGEWLPAKILKVLKDGGFDVSWEEDGSMSTLPADYVRKCA